MKFAKLEKSELFTPVQCIGFVNQLDNEALKLLEVDKSVLQSVKSGDRWAFVFAAILGYEYVDVASHVSFLGRAASASKQNSQDE